MSNQGFNLLNHIPQNIANVTGISRYYPGLDIGQVDILINIVSSKIQKK